MKLDQPHIGYLTSIGGAGGIIGAIASGFVVRKLSLRTLLMIGVVTAGASTFLYLTYDTYQKAMFIDFLSGLFGGFAEVAIVDLAARATPAGCEGLGYSLILSCRNLALFGADFLGSKLADDQHWSWGTMVTLNGATTLVVLILLPFIPRIVLASRDLTQSKTAA